MYSQFLVTFILNGIGILTLSITTTACKNNQMFEPTNQPIYNNASQYTIGENIPYYLSEWGSM